MSRRSALVAAAALLVSACRSPTLFQPCASTEDCGGRLACLEAAPPLDTGGPEAICTTTCEVDGDCPIQEECGGTGDQRRARCVDGVCSVRFCD